MSHRITSILALLITSVILQADSLAVRYANNFEIVDYGTHKIISVSNAFRNSTNLYHYALVPREAKRLPKLPQGAVVIRTPVERIVTMETVTIGYLELLGKIDSIIATGNANYISNPKVQKRIKDGKIATIQYGQALDVEQLLLLQPDLIITSTLGDSTFDLPPELERTQLPVALSASYMEQHPLARTEWLKFIAAFFEETDQAADAFDQIEKRYLELTELTKDIGNKPTVLSSAPYSGSWHVPGGNSYTAQTIRDAGGDYLWSEDPSEGGIPLDTERVFLKAADADFWINPSHHKSMASLLSSDTRFDKFSAFRGGHVYNNTRRVAESGGNAFWESGVVEPDKILADMIHIFHPDLLPEHEFVYYEQLD